LRALRPGAVFELSIVNRCLPGNGGGSIPQEVFQGFISQREANGVRERIEERQQPSPEPLRRVLAIDQSIEIQSPFYDLIEARRPTVNSEICQTAKSRLTRLKGHNARIPVGATLGRREQGCSSPTVEVPMSILALCDAHPAAVSLEASRGEAIRTVLDRHVGAVAVIDHEQRVAGIFTKRDVLRKLALSGHDPERALVRDTMTTPLELATAETGSSEAFLTMVERHFRHLPVVDHNGKLLGMLSIRNPLEWRIEDLTRELGSLEQYLSNDAPGGD
jgi:predicted transcriptional regulator